MFTVEEGHPCFGKDCTQCESCIFDEDLFKEEPIKENKNMCNKKLCNECIHLEKNYDHTSFGRFDASCKLVSYSAFGKTHSRRIDYNVDITKDIYAPTWCPFNDGKEQLSLPATTSTPTSSSSNGNIVIHSSYNDKREKMKGLKRHLEWCDIKEGGIYVIPKILSQARKIVKVITKTEYSCVCHEISEYTGTEFSCNTTFYPSDLDAVFITEKRNF